jgi:hypothetical protein
MQRITQPHYLLYNLRPARIARLERCHSTRKLADALTNPSEFRL